MQIVKEKLGIDIEPHNHFEIGINYPLSSCLSAEVILLKNRSDFCKLKVEK